MPTLASSNILTPKSWDEFENITLDAAKIRWSSPNFYRNGRQGQKQDGVDIFSAPGRNISIGVQCKNTIHGLPKALVEKEITNAESFTPPLNKLYIATTASRDATLQEHVRKISKARTDAGEFSVDLLFWEDISGDLVANEEVFYKHYPQFAPKKEIVVVQNTVLTAEQVDEVIRRAVIAARELVVTVRRELQFSSTVVPVGLNIIPDDQHLPPVPTNLDEVIERTSSGESFLLYGEGGIGKTTAAIELARRMLDVKCPRIPLFIDAAAWSSTDLPLLDYIVSLLPFLSSAINLSDLARLVSAGRITLVINGWNEIPATNQERCAQRMKQVTGAASNINVVLTAREAFDKAGLFSPIKVRVTGLSWVHQKEFIRSQLEVDQATALIEILARNNALRVAARNPFVLTGVVRLQQHGIESAQGSFNIFKAIIENYENEGTRGASLRSAPLGGMHVQYLEALACEMNRKQGATLTVAQARSELTKVIRQLDTDGQFINLPNTPDVLQALCNHHLLFADGNLVRFAHQRFQEYFAASHLITRLTNTNQPSAPQDDLLVEAVNWPFWEDALLLVAEKLAEDKALLSAKVTLIETARRVDIGIACVLAGVAKLQRADDAMLYERLVNTVFQLSQSPVIEVAEYATTCMIDTGFDAFADYLWHRLESEDQKVRLNLYQLGHSSISVRQLGTSTKQRIMAWTTERRAEFVHEIAKNPDNAELLEELALRDESDKVKAAAITAIAWDFPASEFALSAWKNASDSVKLDDQLLSLLDESLLEAGEDVRQEIVRLATNAPDEKKKVSLALRFPDWLGAATSEALLRELSQDRQNDALAALMRRIAPEQFLDLATDLCLTKQFAPDWAKVSLLALSSQERSMIFEKAWTAFRPELGQKFSTVAIGACANREQTLQLVHEWLQMRAAEKTELGLARDTVRYMLANVPGDDLVSVVLELGRDAEHGEAEELIELVSHRIGPEPDRARDDNPWLPTSEQVDNLIGVFWKKIDPWNPPHNLIRAKLSTIASRVDATRYSNRILEGCRSELDAWTRYHEVLDKWLQEGGGGHRPSNPPYGNYITSALVRCGFDVLTELLDLIAHPQAHQFVFGAIAQILAKPWSDQQPRALWSPAADGKEAKARREAKLVMLQPDPALQATTDQVARKLIEQLAAELHRIDAGVATAKSDVQARWINRHNCPLLMALAAIPSRECLQPLWSVLARGDIGEYTFVDVLCSLVHQGVFIDDESVVQRMQYLLEKDSSANWLDESAKHRFGQLNALLYFVKPTSLLDKPLTDYLPKCAQICHDHEVINSLEAVFNDEAWRSLVHLARNLNANQNIGMRLANVIASGLNSSNFESFLELINDGTFFRLNDNDWELEHMAGKIVDVIGADANRRGALIAACSQSIDIRQANILVCAVLAASKGGEEDMVAFGLRAFDNNPCMDGRYSAIHKLRSLFAHYEPLGNAGTHEVYPKSCNMLRHELYVRATGTGQIADRAKAILCEIEATRRDRGRPTDEPRHPDIDRGLPWSDALVKADIQASCTDSLFSKTQ